MQQRRVNTNNTRMRTTVIQNLQLEKTTNVHSTDYEDDNTDVKNKATTATKNVGDKNNNADINKRNESNDELCEAKPGAHCAILVGRF